MDRLLYPLGLLDRWDIADLPVEHKLVVTALAAHPRLSCCAVLTATQYVVRSLPLPADVVVGLLADLDRRSVVAFDQGTAEAYLKGSFSWHRVPNEGEDGPWARQVRAAVANIRSCKVREAVSAELLTPPSARDEAILIPSNLLTALPARGIGRGWSATEMLVAFVLAVHPEQTPAGVCRVVSLDGLAALASVPTTTLLETINSLSALSAAGYDPETGELFVASRLRCAGRRDHRRIDDEAQLIDSPLILKLFLFWSEKLKIKITRNQWLSSQLMECKPNSGDLIEAVARGNRFLAQVKQQRMAKVAINK